MPILALLAAACDTTSLPPDLRPPPGEPSPVDGVYRSPAEVWGFQNEMLELDRGRFRYWFSSDVHDSNAPRYPLTGAYAFEGDVLTLHHDKVHRPRRTFEVVRGHPVLWRDDSLPLWRNERRVHAYGVLFRTGDAPWDGKTNPRELPSIRGLYDDEMTRREEREYDERFNDQPAEARRLLRAATLREDDPNLDQLKAALAEAREDLGPVTRQLIGLCSSEELGVEASTLLERLYCSDFIFPEDPFGGDEVKRYAALEILTDALGSAPDRQALDDALTVFLRASGIGQMDHAIPEAGVRIRLLVNVRGSGGTYASDSLPGAEPPPDAGWTDRIGVVADSCRRWCREQLDRRFRRER